MNATFRAVICSLAAVLAFAGISAYGQAVATVQISGVVKDQSGGIVPDASVTATQTETGFSRNAISGSDGEYLLPQLPVGPYRLTIEKSGYKTFVQNGILLQVGDHPQIDIPLAIGEVTQRVEVSANAEMVQATQTSVSTVIDQRRIVQLPLNGRQATQMIILAGGAAPSNNGGAVTSKNYPSSVALSVTGGSGGSTNYLMDGADNEDAFTNVNQPFPFPDALQEFNVETSVTSASHGLHPGATVNVVTKSGTNQFHGDLFEFIRNGAFNANNFFSSKRDTLHRNQFGGTIGGPILRNRLFFFAGYQGTRNRQNPASNLAFVPTPAMLAGNFSACPAKPNLSDPSGIPYFDSTNHTNPNRYSAPAVALATKYFPATSDPCGAVRFGIPTTGDEDQIIGRGDWNLGSKQVIFGRYFVTDYRNPAVFDGKNVLATARPGILDRAQNLVVGHTYTLSSHLVNSGHFRFSRTRINRGPAANLINPTDLGITTKALVKNFVDISATGAFATGCGTCAPGHFDTNSYQGADDVDLIMDKHHVSFGGEYFRDTLDWLANTLSNGQYVFNGQFSGSALSDFLFGRIYTVGKGMPLVIHPQQNIFSLYAQDTWQAEPNLTITMGLRWEPLLPESDPNNIGVRYDAAAFAAGTQSQVYTTAPPGFFYYGDKGIPKAFTARDWNNFAPRIGVSWHPKSNDRSVLRASYGMFYQQPILMYIERFSQVSPFGDLVTLLDPTGGFANPLQQIGGDPFPLPTPPPKNAFFVPFGSFISMTPNMPTPYMQQWNLVMERQLGADLVAKISYIGNNSFHLWNQTEANPAVYQGASSTTTNTNLRRRLYLMKPGATTGGLVGSIAQADPEGIANYNGVIASVNKRFSRNFSVLANYTYSHCLDETDNANDLAFPQYQNPDNARGEYGNCAYDHRQIFNVSIVAVSPSHFGNRFTSTLIRDWEISAISSSYTGDFVNPVTGSDQSRTGVGNDRPNISGPSRLSQRTAAHFFNTSVFTANPLGTFGNARHNSVLGAGSVNLDMGLARHVKFTEARDLEIRGEFFNILNHPNYLDPAANLSSVSTFGKVTTAADPRIIQLSAKIHF